MPFVPLYVQHRHFFESIIYYFLLSKTKIIYQNKIVFMYVVRVLMTRWLVVLGFKTTEATEVLCGKACSLIFFFVPAN